MMKIAIHPRKGSYSSRWIEYCEEQGIAYKIVNCYKHDIIEQLDDCDAPIVPTYVFFSRKEALEWVKETTFPKVFKLRGGAASDNVKLVHRAAKARRLIRKSFGRGFGRYSAWGSLKERWRLYRLGQTNIYDCLKGLARFMVPTNYCRIRGRDKGYAYFQDFIPMTGWSTG